EATNSKFPSERSKNRRQIIPGRSIEVFPGRIPNEAGIDWPTWQFKWDWGVGNRLFPLILGKLLAGDGGNVYFRLGGKRLTLTFLGLTFVDLGL
nr:hypothetical protein [Tanacetum cinerariifolium]